VILFTCSRDDGLLDNNSLHPTVGVHMNLSASAILAALIVKHSKSVFAVIV